LPKHNHAVPATPETQVVIAGAGPIGRTAAIELARRGIDCRIVDPLLEPALYAKAVGVQPRTLEVFEGMGLLRSIFDAAIQMRGQIVYVNGELALAVEGHAADACSTATTPNAGLSARRSSAARWRSARAGIGADSTDPSFVIRREGQLLIDYAGSPIVADGAGARAPDATGLTRDAVTGPLRLFDLLGRREHTLLLYAPDGAVDVETFERTAAAATTASHGQIDVYLIAAPDANVTATELPVIRDSAGEFAKAYEASGPSSYVVRPDGYLGYAAADVDADPLVAHLRATFT
jgi:FAD binding domain